MLCFIGKFDVFMKYIQNIDKVYDEVWFKISDRIIPIFFERPIIFSSLDINGMFFPNTS